ncbi:unnamed protein product [Rotaria magnacalcarata]|uniref:Repressor of the inhibitor of the protein kinase n=3 Tax=Rotaria magnacalcarata TaxID=392030 RepID=A0A816YJI4_9BILA|nr:unnamed protein product [Rotaria magnacalcarata]CAF4076115.1 unnamed protein product [Rotaria magnacalcarata]
MSADKRKHGSLDSFVTITKNALMTHSSSEQVELDSSEIVSIEVTHPADTEAEEPENNSSSNLNQNLVIIDSHPDTHQNDIGFHLSLRTSITDETKYELLTKPFRPDKKYTFPNQEGKNGTIRRFMPTWLVQHSFLSYSPYYEGAFFSACSLFSSLASNQSTSIFISYPCSRFHHLKHFTTHIKIHLNSGSHKLATTRATSFIRTFENPSSGIDYQLDRNRIEMIEKNKSILLSIIKVVIACARQNIALRGHRGEDITSIREHIDAIGMPSGSNFISLLKQRIDAGDQLLQSHLTKGPRNSTYTSPSIQNELIELIYEHILSTILCRVGPTTLYSIIVDGTTDSSNIEQLCLLIRYVDSHTNEIHEDFLGFVPTTSSTGEAIVEHILSCLKRFKLSLANCIGQAYDGASCMSGIFKGCQAFIKRFCPDAEYMHCSSHALNLALIDSTSSFIRNTFGIIKSVINFFSDSPKRTNALKYEIERPDNDYLILTKKKRLVSLCETRWVERNVAIETFLELYIPISNTLDVLRIEGDSSSQQLYHPVNSFETIVCTCITSFLLSEITPLSRLLQTSTIDFGVAHQHVLSLLKTFDIRQTNASDYFKNIVFEQAIEVAKELFVQPEVPRSYQRRNGQSILDPEEFYRDHVFLPFLIELKANVDKRLSVFSHTRIQLLTQVRPECITAAACSTTELYKKLKQEFSERLPQPLQLFGEVERWKIECIDLMKKPNGYNLWMSDLLTKCNPVFYPNIHFLLVFLATLPVTTSSAERAFSSLKRIKTYCRSTMVEDRLNGLAVAFIHKNVEINPHKILDLFVQRNQRRFDFGL